MVLGKNVLVTVMFCSDIIFRSSRVAYCNGQTGQRGREDFLIGFPYDISLWNVVIGLFEYDFRITVVHMSLR